MLTNRNTPLVPQTAFAGRALTFDFPAFQIGVAEYPEGPTGCTVFLFPKGAATAIDKRGGAIGITGEYEWNHALVLAGGSLYGLEAAAGVAAELNDQRGYDLHNFALVSGAIIWDFGRPTRIYPDLALGQAAVRAARLASSPSERAAWDGRQGAVPSSGGTGRR